MLSRAKRLAGSEAASCLAGPRPTTLAQGPPPGVGGDTEGPDRDALGQQGVPDPELQPLVGDPTGPWGGGASLIPNPRREHSGVAHLPSPG